MTDNFEGWSHPSPAVRRELLRKAFQTYADSIREQQLARFGWTNHDVRFDVDVAAQSVHVTGILLLPRMRISLIRSLRSMVPAPWKITDEIGTLHANASWHVLREPIARLWREYPERAMPLSLSSEIRREDGPVRLLASTPRGSLIETLDGTTGWTLEPVDRRGSSHPLLSHLTSGPSSVADFVRSFVGVPYKLGGTTRDGMDCSGLTQTIYRQALGKMIPRHCRDQFYAGGFRSFSELPLIFLASGAERTPSHVGILLRSRSEWRLIHASSARGLVVEQPFDECLSKGGWHVVA
jgi:hypothetical protein